MTRNDPTTDTLVPAAGGAVPDLTMYRALHQAMRVANDQLVAALGADRPPSTERLAALARWFEGYSEELRTHHHIEDDICFPALAERVPAYADYASTLADDHDRLDRVIDGLRAALGRLACGRGEIRGEATIVSEAVALAVELRDLLTAHLAFEDADVLPLFERHFSVAEYAVLDKAAVKAMSPRQAMFTVPWFMATVDPAIARKTLDEAPLPLKVIHRLTRRRYARLVSTAFGAAS
jgi:hemerythrin-like domain-containing protein